MVQWVLIVDQVYDSLQYPQNIINPDVVEKDHLEDYRNNMRKTYQQYSDKNMHSPSIVICESSSNPSILF